MSDEINHPEHYTQGPIECIDAIASATTGLVGIQAVCAGAVLKYTWRFSKKGGVSSLLKAKWYLDRLIAEATQEQLDQGSV